MKLNVQKKIVSNLVKASRKRVKLDTTRLSEIKEAITKQDIKGLILDGAIVIEPKKGVSRSRARKRQSQKNKGRRKGPGSREGNKNARLSLKTQWVNRIRLQREFLKELKTKKIITNETYRMLYMRAKGGFFRSRRHIKLYLETLK